MPTDWKQTAEDVGMILCDAGDLLRECHDILNECGQSTQAGRVKQFCDKAHRCMVSGEPWTKIKDI